MWQRDADGDATRYGFTFTDTSDYCCTDSDDRARCTGHRRAARRITRNCTSGIGGNGCERYAPADPVCPRQR